ncbi:hypothetical protein MPL3365_130513 [Mesorhizobium plurifarium]|uniref:Uncharacterized protein n=1 Tax=Mesorhizobium plurifarium TaxID=69974 RepID=A0A090G3E7_MESPL|nr:hypothetical protein MPL3365_130513 [Mesorhizobium plurifarium]
MEVHCNFTKRIILEKSLAERASFDFSSIALKTFSFSRRVLHSLLHSNVTRRDCAKLLQRRDRAFLAACLGPVQQLS